jgi:hypothetical protein
MRRIKFGIRTPSFRKRVAARKSGLPGGKRFWRHKVGVKMPRSAGWATNPERFVYNKVYRRTTWSVGAGGLGLPRRHRRRAGRGAAAGSIQGMLVLVTITFALWAIQVLQPLINVALVMLAVALAGIGVILTTAFFFPASRGPILQARLAVLAALRLGPPSDTQPRDAGR